ncbi:MAG: tRNA lysidine(34) synthetase TilS [Hymenobacteraceae bacterium]|nr:tRNA lysidine(34) synthetase TilS [Hymenobacteraceae bacterium]
MRATIAAHGLFDPARDAVVVAVSGGKDSVVLLDALHRLGVRVAVAHAHFGLRGDDADADAEFVRKLAKQLKVPFHLEHFATAAFAEKEKLSTQMAARTLRYAWFARLCTQHGYAAVATGHHAADAAETVLLNLTRGTGLAGLHGIPARTALAGGAASVVRPLLTASTEALYDYLVENQLAWREDASNQDTTHYRRNRLRHDVLPVLRELNPNLDQTLALSAERVRQAEALVAERVAEIGATSLTVEPTVTTLSVAALQRTPATALLLGELLRPYGFDYALARTVAAALGGVSGTRFETATHRLVLDRGQLVITPKDLRLFGSFELPDDVSELKLPGGRVVRTRRVPADGYAIPRKPNVAALDAAKLQFPLTIRAWQPGDWLIPLGMRGKQKVSDLLINAKVPANLKDRVLVLVNGNGSLVWVMGHRPDDRFKVTDATTEVVEMTVA